MYYAKHIPEARVKRCRRTLAIILLFLIIAGFDACLRPMVKTMLTAQARTAFTDAVNCAVLELGYVENSDFVSLQYNEKGVSSIQTDSAAVNLYRAQISSAISECLRETQSEPIRVPIGTLTGIQFLMGRGPCVSMRLVQKGTITADIHSTFTEAGINQTCHKILCDIDAKYYAVIPGYSVPASLNTTVIIAESIIVGESPESFTYVNGDKSDTIRRIYDYCDPYGDNVTA